MLLGTGLPREHDRNAWAIELKWDGLRAQLRVDAAAGWALGTRPGHDCTNDFPELGELAKELSGHRVVPWSSPESRSVWTPDWTPPARSDV